MTRPPRIPPPSGTPPAAVRGTRSDRRGRRSGRPLTRPGGYGRWHYRSQRLHRRLRSPHPLPLPCPARPGPLWAAGQAGAFLVWTVGQAPRAGHRSEGWVRVESSPGAVADRDGLAASKEGAGKARPSYRSRPSARARATAGVRLAAPSSPAGMPHAAQVLPRDPGCPRRPGTLSSSVADPGGSPMARHPPWREICLHADCRAPAQAWRASRRLAPLRKVLPTAPPSSNAIRWACSFRQQESAPGHAALISVFGKGERRRDGTVRDLSGISSRGPHLLVEVPSGAAVAGGLGAPGERVRGDVGEAPPQLRVLLVAEQHDAVAGGPADEPPHPAVDRLDPGGAPGADRRVIKPDGRAVEGQRRLALAGLPAAGDNPDVLHGPAAQDPAEVQFAAHRDGPAACVTPGPFQVPGADEAAEEHELAGVIASRAGDVQRGYQPSTAAGRFHVAGHSLS